MKNICSEFPKLFSDPNQKLTFITTVVATIRSTNTDPIYSRHYLYHSGKKKGNKYRSYSKIES